MISREWRQRRLTVQCNVRGRDVGSFIGEAQQKVAAGSPCLLASTSSGAVNSKTCSGRRNG